MVPTAGSRISIVCYICLHHYDKYKCLIRQQILYLWHVLHERLESLMLSSASQVIQWHVAIMSRKSWALPLYIRLVKPEASGSCILQYRIIGTSSPLIQSKYMLGDLNSLSQADFKIIFQEYNPNEEEKPESFYYQTSNMQITLVQYIIISWKLLLVKCRN